MTSFKLLIEEKEKSHAYVRGVEDFNPKNPCPFEKETREWHEWLEGYKDAEYLHNVIHGKI